ncbi:hypothetical protein [Pedobacter frigoris]|uniref:hypothetical protein n=1 Tax=Pedobacter frigoris TaxID=2571272 RepID=UPI002930BC14|nr:hypothetical protein [Pedobacter frigoris]
MNDQILGFITTAGGLAIGWTLNELSGYFKSGRESKQVLNRILFYQFSIREVILKTNIQSIEKEVEEILLGELPAESQQEQRSIFSEIFNRFVQDELNRRFSDNIKRLIRDYTTAIDDLSRIDPYTTYKVSDKDTVLDYLAYIDDYFNFVETHLQNEKTDHTNTHHLSGALAVIRKRITPYIWESALETIEADIRLIANLKGYWQLFKTNLFLARTRKLKLDRTAVSKIRRYINSFAVT